MARDSRLVGLALLSGITALGALGGCVSNPFELNYIPAPGAAAIVTAHNTLPPPPKPKVIWHILDLAAQTRLLTQQGYETLGRSVFYGPVNQSLLQQASAQGRRVGAAVVLVQSRYLYTVSYVARQSMTAPPLALSVMGSGSPSTFMDPLFNQLSTINLPGNPRTIATRQQVRLDEYVASYWVKLDVGKMTLGALYASRPAIPGATLERDGAVVTRVFAGTPAGRAHLLPGDVLIQINGTRIVDPKGFTARLAHAAGRQVQLQILRGPCLLTVSVKLNP